jgi:hypothetical protein
MTPNQILEELALILPAGLSAYLHGATGIGKSSVVRQYCEAHNLELRDVRASQLDPVDVRGVPVPDRERKCTSWFPPDFLPKDGNGILFLDELNRANQDTQSALYQFILERRLGDYVLPDGWMIMAAGNRDTDGCMVQPMSRALKNRFIHLNMESNYENWHTWAHRNQINEKVIAYMKQSPESLDEAEHCATKNDKGASMDMIRNANSFATPRSWEFASRILDQAKLAGRQVIDLYGVLAGALGEPMATTFVAYCDIYLELQDLDEIIANPEVFIKVTDPNKLYAICTGLAARANKATFGNIRKLLDKVPPEYALWTVDDCLTRNKAVISIHPAYLDFVHKNIEYA